MANNPTHPDRTNNPGDNPGDDQYTRREREEEERRNKNPSQRPRDPTRGNPTRPDDDDNGEETP